MNAVQTIAIAKLIGEQAEKNARKQVAPGNYLADFWMHVTGGIDVGEDYVRKVPQKAKPWDLLAVALSHLNGVTVESITREALSAAPEFMESIKKQAETAIQTIKGMTDTVCSGRITADLNGEIVLTVAKAA